MSTPRGTRRLVALLALGTACTSIRQGRDLHVVGDREVRSPAPAPSVYAAYLRVRVALESGAPDIERARADIRYVLSRMEDAQVWTTAAEVEIAAGDDAAAYRALERALALVPDHAPALALRESLTLDRNTASR